MKKAIIASIVILILCVGFAAGAEAKKVAVFVNERENAYIQQCNDILAQN